MATCLTLCYSKSTGGYLPLPDPDQGACRVSCITDTLLFITLFTVGILAVIGSGTQIGHPLHSIGTIGSLGGSLMMVGGVLIAIPCTYCGCGGIYYRG